MVILESKLSTPNHSPYFIRQRLFSFIENHLDRSLICLTSEGGYGKTTLISSFVREKNIPVIWYQLSHQDRNPRTFLSYIKTAIARKMPNENRMPELKTEMAIEEELNVIMAVLSTWSTRLIIVLDHYQTIDHCEEVEHILTRMITHASPFVTFIITSRVRPNLQLVKFKLQNKLAELKTKDLAFTKQEISQFFSDLYEVTLHEHELDLILNKTEGWVASLQLLQDLIKDMSDAERTSFWVKFSGTPDIYDYLGTEILASQPEEIQSFLYKACLLTDLDPQIINKYLGIHNASEILDYLLKSHLFIYKTNLGVIRHHNLFRSFLYKELARRYSKKEIVEFHSKLAEVYERNSDLFNAFAHLIASNNFFKAAELMKIMKERYHPSKFLILIDGLIENISPDLSSASISLFLFRCIPVEILKDLIAPLEIIINDMKEKMRPISLARFQHQLSAICFYCGEINKSQQLCSDSLSASMIMNVSEMISINLSLKSLIAMYMGNTQEAVQSAQEALSYPDNGHFHPNHLALWILAEISLEQNDLAKAESLIKETFKLSEQRYDCTIIYPYCSMAKYYRLQGQQEEALNWIKKAEDLAVKFHLGYDLGWIYMELAMTYLATKQYTEAELHLSKSAHYLMHSSYLKCKVKQLQIHLWNQQGKQERILDTEKEIEKICKEKNYHWFSYKTETESQSVIIKNNDTPIKLSIYALGNFTMKYEDQIITLKRKASLHLLQYFISHRETSLIKDHIIDEIFPEGSPESANQQFYVALSSLRKALEPGIKSGRNSRFLKQNGEHYSLCTDHLYLDVLEFTKLVQIKDGPHSPERIHHLKKAERLYRGDYFEGYPYIDFLESERETLRSLYLNVLRELAHYHWDHSDYHLGMEYYEKIIKKDPYQENIYSEYMERLLKENLFAKAKKVSELYQDYIEKELGIPVQTKIRNMFKAHSQNLS